MAARLPFRPARSLLAASLLVAGLPGICAIVMAQPSAQSPTPVEFDVVSIKRVDELRPGGGMRILPDGTIMMTNSPLSSLISLASPVPVTPRDIVGMPDWLMREPYDLTAKPPAGLTREQLREAMPAMWRAMFSDRTGLVAHVEQREKDAYILMLAHSDGRLGPNLKPSTLDCTPHPDAAPQTPPAVPTLQERQSRCGMSTSRGSIVSGSVSLAQLAKSMSGLAGGEIDDRTGLTGPYSVSLTFSLQGRGGAAPDANAAVNDAPDFFTAVQEQLGLKLQREKRIVPVFVIDRIERPSAN